MLLQKRICSIEGWSFELLLLLSGLLPHPKLETAVLSICFNISTFAFMVSSGFGVAISIRVSNELGAGRPHAAHLATRVVKLLAFCVGMFQGIMVVLLRNILGHAYSNNKEVTKYTHRMLPFVAASIILDCQQCALSGVVRGCGWQKRGAFINLAAYYLVGIPAAVIFAFVFHLRGMGLWFGLLCGLLVQTIWLLSITLCMNWDKEALMAKDRVSSSTPPVPAEMSTLNKSMEV